MRSVLFLLFASALSLAGPSDSLTGADMIAERAARRAALIRALGDGTAIVFASAERPNLDRRPDPNLRYLTGVTDDRAALLVRKGTVTLYLGKTGPHRARYEGPRLGPGPAAAAATGIADVRSISLLFADLEKELADGEVVYLDTRSPLAKRVRDLKDLKVRPLRSLVAPLRVIKGEEEIARIRRACELTATGLVAAMKLCRPGKTEYELQAVLEYACRRGGAPRQAFPSIAASGPNALILHYFANRRTIEDGDLVVMDVGAEYMGYAADVTRTFPAGGRFTGEQAKVYDTVLAAQLAAIRAVRPGTTLREVHRRAVAVIRAAGYERGIRHATSHHIGLDVHDPGMPGELRPGMVFSVEPGIYLDEERIGVRIEDTVLVTEKGCRVLSDGVPRTRPAIEALMAE